MKLFHLAKRSIDILGSIILFIIFSPLILITSILVKLNDPGPVFFTQKRVGKDNREFQMYKFRTMYIGNNDERLKKYPALYKKYIANDWKLDLKEDPRVTPIGKIIRGLSIDELPQIINIFRGEMSLVGHRAYREEELNEYQQRYPHMAKYIQIIRTAKPGLTGLWQVSGRNRLGFEDRAKLDAKYIQSNSLLQDLKILFKTPIAMFSHW